jgi:hypothetical protein
MSVGGDSVWDMSPIAAAVPGTPTDQLVDAVAACAAELAARPAPHHPGLCFAQAEMLGRAVDTIEAALAARVAVADRHGEPQRWGYPSATSWLRTRLGMRHSRADDRATLARQLDRLPQVARRVAAGDLSFGYASVIAGALRRLDDADAEKGERILLDLVDAEGSVKEVAAAGDRIRQLIAERDGTESEPEDGRRGERQWWTIVRGRGGQAFSKGLFGPELTALIRAKIEPLARPTGADDTRDHGQRMADALQAYLSDGGTGWDPILIIELKQPIWTRRTGCGPESAATTDSGSATDRNETTDPADVINPADVIDPHTVIAPGNTLDKPAAGWHLDGGVDPAAAWEMSPPAPCWPMDGTPFAARLPDGTPIPVRRARQILLSAGFSALVLGTDGQPLYLGRKVRCATPHQRRALNVRYRTCAVTLCDIPANLCEIDHADGWAIGDVSDVDKLAPLCQFHNRFKYEHPDRIHVTVGSDRRYRYDLIPARMAGRGPGDRRPGHNPDGHPPERGP